MLYQRVYLTHEPNLCVKTGDNKQMNILLERSLSIACEDFVDKLENDSVSEYIDFAMEQCIKHLRTHSKPGIVTESGMDPPGVCVGVRGGGGGGGGCEH